MLETNRASSLITLAFLFLLPIFFVPGGILNLNIAKSVLLVLYVVIVAIVFLWETWKVGKLDIPWHPFLFTVVLLPLVYLLSAFLATPSSLSLFGYNFEVGTFGFMLLGSTFLMLGSTIFSNTKRSLDALGVLLISISVVAVFVLIKVIGGGGILIWGNFFGNMGNSIGNWTDLGVVFGLLSASMTLVLGMIPMKFSHRILAYVVFVLGVALLAIVNFSTAFFLTLGASVFLFLYFSKLEKHFLHTASTLPQASANFFLRPTFLPIVLGVISIVFLANPTISKTQGKLGEMVANTFQMENTDVRPSFSATLGISKAVLSQGGLLGSGPNTFGRDWLFYKPIDINATPFWAAVFPFGVGFIPTQIASTGIAGTASWLAFFVLLIFLGVKALSHIPESREERLVLVSAFLATFFLWISSFLYAPSIVVLMLAFIFSSLFVSACWKSGIIPSRSLNLKDLPQNRFISRLLLLVLVVGALYLGWIGLEKTVSAYHFEKAVRLSSTAGSSLSEIEARLQKAVAFSPVDTYYVALSRINFAKAQVAMSSATGTPEGNRAIFEESLRKSIEAAKSAVSANPASYQNWVSLGVVYGALVPKPFSVGGAYENAIFAYSEASKRNPNNPELPLLLARLELDKGDASRARSFIMNAIALKEDYADAYLMLAQLEIQEGNTALAIIFAEKLAILMPNNPGIYFELGLLKYANKDYLDAEKTFRRALSLTPDYANAKYYLGLSLVRLGRLSEAREQFEALLKTNPDSQEVKAALDAASGKKPTVK